MSVVISRFLTPSSIAKPMMKKVPVVFASADPGHKLWLDEDLRRIKKKVREARYRDVLAFNVCPAARLDDLVQALYDTPPQIVHFSGHGGREGLLLVGADGCTPDWVSADDLKKLFGAFRDGITVVVLSACSTRPQAEVIAEIVGCAIGTPAEIEDEAAITFNAEFYRAIAYGESVKSAYEKACGVLGGTDLDRVRPDLVVRPGVNPAELFLVSKPMPPGVWMAAVAVLAVTAGLAFSPLLGGAAPGSPGESETPGAALSSEDLAVALAYHQAGNFAASFPRFKRAAEVGSVEAMGYLGIAYMRGEGTARDPESAAHWLTLAANKGDVRAMNALGLAFEDGFGVGRSYRFARQWYEKAALTHDPEAIRNLARLNQQGLGMDP